MQFRWQRVARALTEADGPTAELVDIDEVPSALPFYERNKVTERDWRIRIARRQEAIASRMLG